MKIISRIEEAREIVSIWRTEGLKVGFVPTMGYLHAGHESLIRRASEENDRVVVSIFVNAIQFEENHDFASYPKDLKRDAAICDAAGAQLLFNPTHEEMYPEGFSAFVDMDGLTDYLCGKSRDSHFRGVCTVLTKLFNILRADKAYFGKKDAQQVAVVKKMVKDLNFNIQIVECETIRDTDGLAKSSRNVRLSPEEREAALIISKALRTAESKIAEGATDSIEIQACIREKLATEKLARVDYVEIVDAETLKPIQKIEGKVLVAVAVFIGKTRLIDNFVC